MKLLRNEILIVFIISLIDIYVESNRLWGSEYLDSSVCAVVTISVRVNNNIRGNVFFEPNKSFLARWMPAICWIRRCPFQMQVKGEISGLTPGQHGMHIHEYGSLVDACHSTGGHFNPTKAKHGGPDHIGYKHIGDLGNIVANNDGVARFEFDATDLSLIGPMSIIGRALVIHEHGDDLGRYDDEQSQIDGQCGKRIACGVIGLGISNYH